MRGLYRVIAVDYESSRKVVDKEVIASSEENAKIVALASVADLLDDLDIKAIKIMDVREKSEL